MAAIIKGHVASSGPQADAVFKTLRDHGVQVTQTDDDLYDLYLSAVDVDAESGMRSLVSMLDREQPDWRNVVTLSA